MRSDKVAPADELRPPDAPEDDPPLCASANEELQYARASQAGWQTQSKLVPASACYSLKLAQERDPEPLSVWHNIETEAVFTVYDADQLGQAAKFALSPAHQTIFEVEEGLIASLLVF